MSNVSLVSLRAEIDNIPEVNSSSSNPLTITVNTGRTMGDLSGLAKLAASATLDRILMDSLIREKIGTKKMELEAIKVYQEASKGEDFQAKQKGVKNNAYIQEN